MTTATCGPASPQPTKRIDSSLFVAGSIKSIDYSDEYTPFFCEECGRPLTEHDRQEAPYADRQFLCAGCRAAYMELHHSDPFSLMTGGSAA